MKKMIILTMTFLCTFAVLGQSVVQVARKNKPESKKKVRFIITNDHLKPCRHKMSPDSLSKKRSRAKPDKKRAGRKDQYYTRQYQNLLTEKARKQRQYDEQLKECQRLRRVVIHKGRVPVLRKRAEQKARKINEAVKSVEKRISSLRAQARKEGVLPVVFRKAKEGWNRRKR